MFRTWVHSRLVLLLVVKVLVIVLVLGGNCRAENILNVKGGIQDILCEGADSTPVLEISYEYRKDWWGLEAGVGGISPLLHNTQTGTEWVGKAAGRLNSVIPYFNLKCYLPFDLYIGSGLDYYWNSFVENRRVYLCHGNVQVNVDDELGYHIMGGWNFADDWGVEGKYTIADLDLESGVPDLGILEAHSRLTSYSIMVVKRWKF